MTGLAAVGLLSLLAQVVVLRELGAAFFGIELVYVLALACWLAGTAAGAAAGRAFNGLTARYLAGFAVAGGLLLGDVAFVRSAHGLLGGVPGAYLPLGRQVAAVALSVLPLSILFGALFVWAAVEAGRRGGTLARSYAIESGGALAGGVWATLALTSGQSNLELALTAALLSVAVSLSGPRPRRGAWRAAAGVTAVLVAVLGFRDAHVVDLQLSRIARPSLLDEIDTPFGRVAVSGRAGQIAVFSNGALVFENQGTGAEVFAALAGIQHPDPRRALVLGGGPEGVVRELRKQVSGPIVHIELDPRADAMVTAHLPRPDHDRTVYGDPRRLVRPALGRFDLVLIALPAPASGEASRFYTREFFAETRQVLAPGGVLALRLPASENLWSPPMRLQNASVFRALGEAFPRVSAVPGSTLYLFASDAPMPPDGATASRRLEQRRVVARLARPAYVRYLYDNDRRTQVTALLRTTDTAPTTDQRPVCYRHAMLLWLSKFDPRLWAYADPAHAWPVVGAVGAILAAGLWWARRTARRRAMAFAFVAGLWGMLVESAVLLHDQITRGVVFGWMGVLLGCFMAGLTVGALVVDRRRAPVSRRGALSIAGALAALAAGAAGAMAVGTLPGAVGAGLTLLVAGAAGGASFAAASHLWANAPDAAVSRLYAADLAGGCAGALLASLVLIPLAGIPLTAGAAAVAALAVTVPLATSR